MQHTEAVLRATHKMLPMVLRYVLAVALATVAFGPIAMGSRALRARILPGWSGSPALLVEIVVGLATVVVVAMTLGAVGLLLLAPTTGGLALAGGALWYVGRRPPEDPEAGASETSPPSPTGAVGKVGIVVLVVAIAAVVGAWATRVAHSIDNGMSGTETLRYHMPKAGRFVQEGSIIPAHYTDTDAGPLIAFYPKASELLHALGIMFLDADFLSLFFNLAFFALALLAAWCIGRPFGVAPVTTLAAVLMLGTPHLVASQAGRATNDVVGVALVLAAVAILVHAEATSRFVTTSSRRLAPLGVAALASGLAAGTKYTFLPIVAVLTIGVIVVSPSGTRVRRGAVWIALLALTGGFWYVRNLTIAGNPLPPLELGIGPLALPGFEASIHMASIAEFLFDGSAWSEYFLPGLGATLGPAWWAVLAFALAGIVLGVVQARDRLLRMLAVVAGAAVAAYVVAPQYLGIEEGVPSFFVFNVRYAAHGFLLALVLLAIHPALVGRRARWVLAAFALLLVPIQLDPAIWPTELRELRYSEPIRGGAVLVGAAVGVSVLLAAAAFAAIRRRQPAWPTRAVTLVALGGVVLTGLGLQALYLDNRYAHLRSPSSPAQWAWETSDARIAIVGLPFTQYVLYGRDLSNHVQYVGERQPHGGFTSIESCRDWREALNTGDYDYVVTSPQLFENTAPREQEWTETDPSATLVVRERMASVFELTGSLDPQGCPAPPSGPS